MPQSQCSSEGSPLHTAYSAVLQRHSLRKHAQTTTGAVHYSSIVTACCCCYACPTAAHNCGSTAPCNAHCQ
eukprot:13572-Heterococcus_DN1.PRE.3